MTLQKAEMVTVVFIISLLLLHPISSYSESLKQRVNALGSRPPFCANKCHSCMPCRATLVIPTHRRVGASSHDEDDTYYLLSWKCKCGNKLFQP